MVIAVARPNPLAQAAKAVRSLFHRTAAGFYRLRRNARRGWHSWLYDDWGSNEW